LVKPREIREVLENLFRQIPNRQAVFPANGSGLLIICLRLVFFPLLTGQISQIEPSRCNAIPKVELGVNLQMLFEQLARPIISTLIHEKITKENGNP